MASKSVDTEDVLKTEAVTTSVKIKKIKRPFTSPKVIVSDAGTAGALFVGTLSAAVLGPTIGTAVAFTSLLTGTKDNDLGEAIRGAGNNVISSVNFIGKLLKSSNYTDFTNNTNI